MLITGDDEHANMSVQRPCQSFILVERQPLRSVVGFVLQYVRSKFVVACPCLNPVSFDRAIPDAVITGLVVYSCIFGVVIGVKALFTKQRRLKPQLSSI